jgi:hypothetical protein
MDPKDLPPGAAALLAKMRAGALTDDEKQRLLVLANEVRLSNPDNFATIKPLADGTFLTAESVAALVLIRQWSSKDNPTPSALQRIAGTLFQIGVDYFATVPGALNDNSTQGKIVKALLTSLDGTEFATVDLKDLPARLLVGTIDTIAAQPQLVSGNAHTQLLVQTTAKALATNVSNRIAMLRTAGAADLTKEDELLGWADVVYRSVLQGAGTVVAQDPATFLGVRDASQAALVSDVSKAALAFVLEGHPGLSPTDIGRGALDTVVKAALTSFGQHPGLVARVGNGGLQNLLVQTAQQLGAFSTVLTPDIVPKVTQIILQGTLKNLELIWPHGSTNPGDHLLLTAATVALKALTTTDPAGFWRPSFTADTAATVVQSVADELIANPGWLVDRAGKLDPVFGDVVSAVFATLRTRADNRLSPASAQAILTAALTAVATHQAFVRRLPPNDQLVIAAVLDAVLGAVFDPTRPAAQAWPLVRAAVVEGLVQQSLVALGKTDLGDPRLAQFHQALADEVTNIADGGAWDPNAFAASLAAAPP